MYKGAWTCRGYPIQCDHDEECPGDCYSHECCQQGGGDCGGYPFAQEINYGNKWFSHIKWNIRPNFTSSTYSGVPNKQACSLIKFLKIFHPACSY